MFSKEASEILAFFSVGIHFIMNIIIIFAIKYRQVEL